MRKIILLSFITAFCATSANAQFLNRLTERAAQAAERGVSRAHLLDSSEERGMKPNIFVTFVNSQENKLGKPLPKGVTRLYKEDAKGNMQFVGEDRIQHTADKETVRLAIGSAFNLTVDMKRLAVRRVSDSVRMGTYEVTLKNGGDAPAQVQLTQEVPDRFKIMEESQKSERVNSNTVKWVVPVPAKGETKLTYKIQFQY